MIYSSCDSGYFILSANFWLQSSCWLFRPFLRHRGYFFSSPPILRWLSFALWPYPPSSRTLFYLSTFLVASHPIHSDNIIQRIVLPCSFHCSIFELILLIVALFRCILIFCWVAPSSFGCTIACDITAHMCG